MFEPLFVFGTLFVAVGVSAQSGAWGQCGGIGWTGASTCVSGYYCSQLNAYYYQCIPGAGSSTFTTKTTSTTTSRSSTTSTKSSTTTTKPSTSTTTKPSTTTTTSTAPTSTSSSPPLLGAPLKILVGAYSSLLTTLSFQPTTNPPSLSILTTSYGGSNPSWIATNPTNKSIVYATQENYNGQVLSFIISSSGSATQVGTVYSGGQNPAHVAALSNGQGVFVTDYNTGHAEYVPVTGATFGTPGTVLQFMGSGPNVQRQLSSHPHEAVENGSELLVTDLGADKTWRLTQSGSTWQITGLISHPAGSGPRHMAVVDNYLYTVHELSATITQHTLPPLDSAVLPVIIASLSTAPAGVTNGSVIPGEIFVSPTSSAFPTQYLYVSNRNDPNPQGDTIAIFSMNPLTLVTQVRTGLQVIRSMAIGGPNGEYIVAGGQTSGGISVFERVNGGASLSLLANVQGVQSPTSFVFL